MTNINKLFAVFCFTILFSCNGEIVSVTINTPTIQCGMCQATIEKGLSKLNGVSKSKVDLKTKTTNVSYSADKTDVNQIEKAISNLGYEANGTKADQKAYDELYPCCKIGGMDKK